MDRAQRLTKELKSYDRQLLCKKENGIYKILRKTTTYELYDFAGSKLLVSQPFYHLIMALTHNWQIYGEPCEWGALPILARLKAMDLWQNDKMAADLIKGYEKEEESKERDFRNNVESFLREFRPQFAKATNNVNTSTLDKFDKRRMNHAFS